MMKVFISHAANDAKLAKRVAQILHRDGFQVWDERQILPGDNWAEKLAEALQESQAMVILLTPSALHASHITHELEFALGHQNYKHRIIPVIAAAPDQLHQQDIPWILQTFKMLQLPEDANDESLKQIAQAIKAAA